MGGSACLELSAEPPALIQSLTAFGCLIYWFTDVIIPTKQTYNLPFKGVVKSTFSRSVEPGRLEKCISAEKGGIGDGLSECLSCRMKTASFDSGGM